MALFVAVAMAVTSGMPILSGMESVAAAPVYQNENLSKNSTFEEDVPLSAANGQSHAGNWYAWQKAEKTKEQAHEGGNICKIVRKRNLIGTGYSGAAKRNDLYLPCMGQIIIGQ